MPEHVRVWRAICEHCRWTRYFEYRQEAAMAERIHEGYHKWRVGDRAKFFGKHVGVVVELNHEQGIGKLRFNGVVTSYLLGSLTKIIDVDSRAKVR